jgi:biotin synthase
MNINIIKRIRKNILLEKAELAEALLFRGKYRKQLFEIAAQRRSQFFPSGEIEARSVLEISNICHQYCNFCNISNYSIKKRYLINYRAIMEIVRHIYDKKRRVLLIQSGENKSQNYIDFVSKCVCDIKRRYKDLTIILSLGNLAYAQYKQLKIAGADRYILKFETSNPHLYKLLKPFDSLKNRLGCIKLLNKVGFQVGSGNIIGLPHQTLDDIIKDLLFIRNLKLTMVSSSIFIPGEGSHYYNQPMGDINLTLNYMALMRIMYPGMLIPSTSSLEKAQKGGQYLGLLAGANSVTIHDGTPKKLKKHFPIYSLNRFTPNEKFIKKIVEKAHLKYTSL